MPTHPHGSESARTASGYKWLEIVMNFSLVLRCPISPRIWIPVPGRGGVSTCTCATNKNLRAHYVKTPTSGSNWQGSSSRSSFRNGLCRCRCRKKGLPEWIHIQIPSVRTFFPSSSCVPCANTLSTLFGSPNVMKPKPLQVEKEKETNAHYENHVIKAHSL